MNENKIANVERKEKNRYAVKEREGELWNGKKDNWKKRDERRERKKEEKRNREER